MQELLFLRRNIVDCLGLKNNQKAAHRDGRLGFYTELFLYSDY